MLRKICGLLIALSTASNGAMAGIINGELIINGVFPDPLVDTNWTATIRVNLVDDRTAPLNNYGSDGFPDKMLVQDSNGPSGINRFEIWANDPSNPSGLDPRTDGIVALYIPKSLHLNEYSITLEMDNSVKQYNANHPYTKRINGIGIENGSAGCDRIIIYSDFGELYLSSDCDDSLTNIYLKDALASAHELQGAGSHLSLYYETGPDPDAVYALIGPVTSVGRLQAVDIASPNMALLLIAGLGAWRIFKIAKPGAGSKTLSGLHQTVGEVWSSGHPRLVS